VFKLCKNKNHSYKHNEQINNQNIDNSECIGVKFVSIYPEMTSQLFFEKINEKAIILLKKLKKKYHTPRICSKRN
jgi:hypothetical protein